MTVLYSLRNGALMPPLTLRVSSMNWTRMSTKTLLLCCSPEIAQHPKPRPSPHLLTRSTRLQHGLLRTPDAALCPNPTLH